MALFSSGRPASRFDGGDINTVVGPEAYFQGSITVRGSLRVEGEVEGSIREAQSVVVGTNGRVQGDISAERVVVAGFVRGDCVAAQQMEIRAGGRVYGNIRTTKLTIEEGATFEGNCAMGAAGEPTAAEGPGRAPAEEGAERKETVRS